MTYRTKQRARDEESAREADERRERRILACMTGLCSAISVGDNSDKDHAGYAIRYAETLGEMIDGR